MDGGDCELDAAQAAALAHKFITRNRERNSRSNREEFLARKKDAVTDDGDSCARTDACTGSHKIHVKHLSNLGRDSNPLAKTMSAVGEAHIKRWTLAGLPEGMVGRVNALCDYLGCQIDRLTLADVTLLMKLDFCFACIRRIQDGYPAWAAKNPDYSSHTPLSPGWSKRQFAALCGSDQLKALEDQVIAIESATPVYAALVFHHPDRDTRLPPAPATIWMRTAGGKWHSRQEGDLPAVVRIE
ncbi:hypothetical protein RI367_006006 [Sorochytrium milnesiophthora]